MIIKDMENYQGDLTDILRQPTGTAIACGSAAASDAPVPAATPNWLQFPSSDPINFSSSTTTIDDDHSWENSFGDPFSNMRDPLLHHLNVAYFSSPNSTSTDHINITTATATASTTSVEDSTSTINISSNIISRNIFEDEMKSPCNNFSRIQISPSSQTSKQMPAVSSPRRIEAPVMIPTDMINANASKSCLLDNTGPLQISSPRNLGIKRRKSQAKKVVCIPAPAAANSRSSGEVVPSDLWAWRKYGQKPIKGSPYPRGYYRCSSSKGCSARKQVERSRTDPNMLVITYTSEHNHPWPTQRNALAGSTRSQPAKNSSASSSSKSSLQPQNITIDHTNEEVKDSIRNDSLSPVLVAASNSSVKEEIDKHLEMDDAEYRSSEGLNQSYKPALPDNNNAHQSHEDFFADLDEIEAGPLNNLLFTQRFSTGSDENKEDKAVMDPFSLFDWSGDNTSFGDQSNGFITRP